jgi:hypothetical protein
VQISHDLDCIGAGAAVWSIANKKVPSEVVKHIEERLDKLKMPSLATTNISQGADKFKYVHVPLILFSAGPGFTINLNGILYNFPYSQRSPPELHFGYNYTAYVLL